MIIQRVIWPAILALSLVACGGGGGGGDGGGSSNSSQPQTCRKTSINYCPPSDPFGIALIFAWYGGLCTREVACVEDAPETNLEQGVVREEFINSNWLINHAEDQEPNNTLEEALPFVLQKRSVFSITGMLNDTTDPVDYVVFGSQSDDTVAIYICNAPGDCLLPFYKRDDLYIELFDQAGNLMRSSYMAQSGNGHEITFVPTVGLTYYAAIHAVGSAATDIEYELVITD